MVADFAEPIKIAEKFMNTKLVAIVGQGSEEAGSSYPSNKIFLWQDITVDGGFITKRFKEDILNIRIRHDM